MDDKQIAGGIVPAAKIRVAVQNVDIRPEKNVQLTREVSRECTRFAYDYFIVVNNVDLYEGKILATSDSNARDLVIANNSEAILSGDYRLAIHMCAGQV
ncbi:hypothetical protein LCGC14_1795590 [marine sediment metagenome]|uniref:Uncharacterized protein n=1 Tax=marine sediment metagenome TaxID=412755 RepID=A0A0F9GRD3_9ZZZZ